MTPLEAYRSLDVDVNGFVHGLDFLLAAGMSAPDLERAATKRGGMHIQWGQYPWTDRGRLPFAGGPWRAMRGYPKKVKVEVVHGTS